jgi:hypothetical protein
MKNVFLALALVAFAAPAFAETNAADNNDATVKTSKNIITGTVTRTKKTKNSAKRGKNMAKLETTETTKTKTNGEVDKKVEVKGESTDKTAVTK